MENIHVLLSSLCTLLVITGTYGRTTRSAPLWRDCSQAGNALRVQDIQISPHPVVMPGSLYFSMRGYSSRIIGRSRLVLDIKRKGRWFDVTLPCIYNIGSCTYHDMCTMLDDMINDNWVGITEVLGRDIKMMLETHGLNSSLCPQPAQTLNINPTPIRLPTMPASLTWFAAGTYEANVRVIDNSNNEELTCLDITLNIQQACDGWFGCFFK